jgi:hypothetical protein
MVHKQKVIQYDEYGDPINLDPKEKKWLDYKRFFRHTPDKVLRKVFDKLWTDMGGNFDAMDLEHHMAPELRKLDNAKHDEDMKSFEKENFVKLEK